MNIRSNYIVVPQHSLKKPFHKKLIINFVKILGVFQFYIYIKFLKGISYLKTSEDIYLFFYFSESNFAPS